MVNNLKKLSILLVLVIFTLSGCGDDNTQAATAAGADNDLLEVPSIDRPLSASNVDQVTEYMFFVGDEVLADVDSFSDTGSVTVRTDADILFNVGYSETMVDDPSTLEYTSVNKEQTFENGAGYYYITVDTPIDLVVSVI